jgi:polyphenol oxidase
VGEIAVDDAGLTVRSFFTTRRGGRSRPPYDDFNVAGHVGDDTEAMAANRALLDGLAGAPVVYMAQTHGNTVARVTSPGAHPDADAIVTLEPGLALAVLVADCVPILLHDQGTGAVAAVHAGRAGVVLGIVGNAVRAMREAGAARSGTISAAIGPSICGRCYEVPEEMREEVAAVTAEAWAETSWGTPSLDLRAAVRAQLREVGIGEVTENGRCTFEDPDLYSHRRDGATGRIAGVVRSGALLG